MEGKRLSLRQLRMVITPPNVMLVLRQLKEHVRGCHEAVCDQRGCHERPYVTREDVTRRKSQALSVCVTRDGSHKSCPYVS
ncbi:hypothetical protein F2Q68_00032930 [Brassica cretica]|uniref:Uncharacterized protein n=1 Tax=Brassica cretica TaxID=69181 RepID=A0A8S9GF55_BRACR|nr:hypothetical protein F2Q68_00032930 [Brassica cretica]